MLRAADPVYRFLGVEGLAAGKITQPPAGYPPVRHLLNSRLGYFIRPGKPIENAFVGSFNGRLWDECLNVHQFASIAEAQAPIEA